MNSQSAIPPALRIVELLASTLVASAAGAAPSPLIIGGAISDGAVVTISGSGFGTEYSTPLLWDNFERPEGPADLTVSSSGPLVGKWVLDSRPIPVRSRTRAHSGHYSLYARFDTGAQWSHFTVRLPPADRIYQTFWFWWTSTGTRGQLKLAQVHGDAGVGDFAPGVMTGGSRTTWWMSYISTESSKSNLQTRVNYPQIPEPGAWHHFEMALQRSSRGGSADGSVVIWIDNRVVYSMPHVVTRESSSHNWNETSFFHGVTNMGGSTDVYIDDTYVNTTWARVVLGNAPTYGAVTQTELQPVSSWSDSVITATLNMGSLPGFDVAYVYVFDGNGQVNVTGLRLCQDCKVFRPAASPRAAH
jgi:hypothetical protein